MTRTSEPAQSACPATDLELLVLPGEIDVHRLENGLTLCELRNPQAPVVTSALWYRVGAMDEPAGQAGLAHLLEHMMFKGSARYGPGQIDRRTQALGGSNNAFTTHDSTAYYFQFSREHWRTALEIEADRSAGLTLDPHELAREKRVVVEEIAMYQDDPWDALDMQVHAAAFPRHPYGRPVLGYREEVLALDGDALRAFHESYYRPDNAVLVVAGDIPDGIRDTVEEAFSRVPTGSSPRARVTAAEPLGSLLRIERRHGEVARLLLALPAPQADHPDHPRLRLLLAILALGRSSRLHRTLVDEGQRCVWVSADLSEMLQPGLATVALEVVPGVDPGAVEEILLEQLEQSAMSSPEEHEVERAMRMVVADWVFGHERIHQQALTRGFALSLLDVDYPERYLEQLLSTNADELQAIARRYLAPERGGVLGWALPGRAATA